MKNKVSNICGVGSCDWYDSNQDSHCILYSDRRICSKSMKRRRKNKYHSKIKEEIRTQ
jgi:hypothetical protein